MVISKHSPESCPGRPGNEEIIPCLNRMQDLLTARGIKTVGKWADPPSHVNFLVLDAPDAHAILQVFMDSGLSAHTATEIRAVMSMG
ncbi:MAG: hypothetical protein L0209_06190 [candidate division Zixibacteria bacterium]|nr:hypothetical protein [candidate division Zixibacteria bacterium]